ncbi:hypothetical protein NQ318_000417 [Aromia moschata]|uniref:WH1 domain-containing protein n=1 Tax=Aromia moschata TaxID=1265417 RepID=A0AAV8YT78_9CUCU|nr:hypothetical protein NQ318_000417 [Aromia moschata]
MYNDSDEYDFNPASSAKLATLFGNTKIEDSFNASLTYTAPKQPKAKKEQDFQESQSVRSKPTTSVLLAKIVSLWKLEDKAYKMLGKHGLAVIGSIEHNLYEVIAYKEKNNILLRKKLTVHSVFIIKKDYFSTLYDNDNQNWLVKFENADDQTTFCQTIKKYGAKIIDKIEETLKNKDEIQANADKESKPELPASAMEVLEKEPEIHSDSSGSQKRATILSRMAKMGQQILPSPLVKNTSTDMSDSELDDTKDDQKVPPRKAKRAGHTEKVTIPKEEKLPQAVQHGYIETQMVPSQSYNFNPQNHNYPMHQPNVVSPVYYNQPMQYDGFTNFILTQNTELKMNLSQISAKLDCVLSQGNASSPKSEDANLKSKIKALELKSENLQNELEAYERRYSELERMYEELKGRIHQDTIENREHEAVIQDLRVEVVQLNEKIKENDDKISDTKKTRA